MKKLAKVLSVLVALSIVLLFVQYRTLGPCGMVKKEWVKYLEEKAESLSEEGQKRASAYGDNAEQVAKDVGDIVEGVAQGVAESVAESRADEMSLGQCMKEMWRIKTGKEPSFGYR
jgi:hypothetical protein